MPLLSDQQKKKHVDFCVHLLNHWGKDPKGKYLWIHYDEKWFWGFVARHAKECADLGLNRQQRFAYHKNHINKVMGTAVVGLAFEGSPNNGGGDSRLPSLVHKRQRLLQKHSVHTVERIH